MKEFIFKTNSKYKAVIYFQDYNKRTFHSRDLDKNNKINASMGLARLRKMIFNFGASVRTAIIYDTNTDQEIERYPKVKQDILPQTPKRNNKSLYKVVIYFKDGNQKSFYSYDTNTLTGLVDNKIGLNKLAKMINKFGDKVRIALMYDNQTNTIINIE